VIVGVGDRVVLGFSVAVSVGRGVHVTKRLGVAHGFTVVDAVGVLLAACVLGDRVLVGVGGDCNTVQPAMNRMNTAIKPRFFISTNYISAEHNRYTPRTTSRHTI
jgi:hypothetical protein